MNRIPKGPMPSGHASHHRVKLASAVVTAPTPLGSDANTETATAGGYRTIQPVVSCGTGTGAMGRMLSKAIAAQSGRLAVIDNKPGASAQIGSPAVAGSAPDGKRFWRATLAFTDRSTWRRHS